MQKKVSLFYILIFAVFIFTSFNLVGGVNSIVPKTYAVCTSWIVSFNANGGTEVFTITQDYNTSVSLPTPTRSGYTFNGWYLDEALTQVADISVMGDEDIT